MPGSRNPSCPPQSRPPTRSGPPKLLDSVRDVLRRLHYSRRTERAYIHWLVRFILFHHKRHPSEMGAEEIAAFLSHLASQRRVSASTQNQALSAILFLYRHVLRQKIDVLDGVLRARRPYRLPVVLTRQEVRLVLEAMDGTPKIMAALLYGTGMRLLECASLRVKDLDFGARHIVVRAAKGKRDRRTILPDALVGDLKAHLDAVRLQHEGDVRQDAGWVELPYSLARKYPSGGA